MKSRAEKWSNKDIKAQGRAALLRNWKPCVIASFLMSMYVPLLSAFSDKGTGYSSLTSGSFLENIIDISMTVATGGTAILLLRFIGISGIVLVILNTVIFNALQTGSARFFLKNCAAKASPDDIGWIFKERYFTALLANFVTDIILTLTGTLLIIPAFVARYTYILTSYIIADEEDISWIKALRRSRRMMRGRKWRYFMYDMSYFGWTVLSMMTLGLVGIFYYNPYKDCADAMLYLQIREDYEEQVRENGM